MEHKDYDWIWVSEEELERKVLADIVWVRERYMQAGQAEPSDADLVRWYEGDKKLMPRIMVTGATL